MSPSPERSQYFTCHNGTKATLPFSQAEYARRLADLRDVMARRDIPAVVLTSMHNIAYYSGFLYCSFGRPFACVVTIDACTTVPPTSMVVSPGADRMQTTSSTPIGNATTSGEPFKAWCGA